MANQMHRVECLDCREVYFRVIPIDISVYCRKCGSAALMWKPA